MSKNDEMKNPNPIKEKTRKITPEEKEHFHKFMANFMNNSKTDPNLGMKMLKSLAGLLPKEALVQRLDIIKHDEKLLENFDAAAHGLTPETFADIVNGIQLTLNGEVGNNCSSL